MQLSRDPTLISEATEEVKGGMLDGEHIIPGLVKQKKYKKSKKAKDNKKEKVGNIFEVAVISQSSDDYVLGHLLESSGVRSVMKHDELVLEQSSYTLVEQEAEKVARAAAASLKNRSIACFF